MSTPEDRRLLLPDGTDATFGEIDAAMTAAGRGQRKRQPAPRALIATVVVIGAAEQLLEPAETLEKLGETGGVRGILIAEGSEARPSVRVSEHSIALIGLKSEFLDNAVGALRLSSLPTLVWWRGGSPDALERLAHLADRLVLDVDDPTDLWPRVPALSPKVAVSDLRWTRLTRWRALMAHFFDVPEVAATKFSRLAVESVDRHAARLFAGWLKSSLGWTDDVRIELRDAPDGAPLRHVQLSNGAEELTLTLVPSRTCVKAAVQIAGHSGASRTASLGNQSLAALMAEELRIRSRDAAFERAVAHA